MNGMKAVLKREGFTQMCLAEALGESDNRFDSNLEIED